MLYPTPKIKNFLIVDYSVNPRGDGKYRDVIPKCFDFMTGQIRRFYPDAFIHVLTDKGLKSKGKFKYHIDRSSYYPMVKTKIYSLLDEPVMYIDTDIIIHRPFTSKHLECENSFNFYTLLRGHLAWTRHAVSPLPYQVPGRYNSGLMWIKEPDPTIEPELLEIWDTYFPNDRMKHDFLINDELLMTCYITKNKLKMNLHPDVNVGFATRSAHPQTTHYWGPRGKDRFLEKISK